MSLNFDFSEMKKRLGQEASAFETVAAKAKEAAE